MERLHRSNVALDLLQQVASCISLDERKAPQVCAPFSRFHCTLSHLLMQFQHLLRADNPPLRSPRLLNLNIRIFLLVPHLHLLVEGIRGIPKVVAAVLVKQQ